MDRNHLGPGLDLKRDSSADILRGLAIILVVFGHINRGVIASGPGSHSLLTTLDFVIYTTHMPVFFFAGGYFTQSSIQRRTRSEYIRGRLWDVVYPYMIWSIIYVLTSQIAEHVTYVHDELGLQSLLSIARHPIHVLWFLYALLILQLLAFALSMAPRSVRLASYGAVTTIYIFYSTVGLGPIGNAIAYAPFFMFGYFLSAKKRPLIPASVGAPLPTMCLVLAFAIAACGAIALRAPRPVSVITLPVSVLGVAMLAAASAMFARKRMTLAIGRHVAWIGTMSLPIYLLHVLTLAVVPRLLGAIGLSATATTLLVGTLFGVYGSLGLFTIIDRVGLSGLLALRSGNPFIHTRG